MVEPISHTNPYYHSTTLQRPYYACTSCILPTYGRNGCMFDKEEVDFFVKEGEKALPYLTNLLTVSNNEPQIVEVMHIMNKMLDNGVKGIDKLYPYFARFNDTTSSNIQSYLAGIYRKTQVPDGFGPLVKMLVRNSLSPFKYPFFDPNEEIGGAILSYVSDKFKK
jgi:hypothetical protein